MGETPIFNACREHLSITLKLLIEWNCDVNVLNINGLNALNIITPTTSPMKWSLSISITDVNTAATVYQQFNNFFKLCFQSIDAAHPTMTVLL
jgi:hypothetical protein